MKLRREESGQRSVEVTEFIHTLIIKERLFKCRTCKEMLTCVFQEVRKMFIMPGEQCKKITEI